jgi:hypothetical protein
LFAFAAELIDTLWSQALVTTGPVPSGYRVTETYAAVPNYARARMLVPVGPAAAATVLRYNALRTRRTRISRRVLGTGLQVGGGPLLLRHQLRVCVRPGDELLLAFLARRLGVDDLVASIGLGAPGPNRKPTLQLFDRSGRPVGYAKIGHNPATRAMVRREAAALSHPAPAGVRRPALLAEFDWHELAVLVTAPMPLDVRGHGPSSWPPDAAVRAVAGPTQRIAVSASPLWNRIETAGYAGDLPDVELEFGAWHGDWVFWNMAWSGRDLWVWDWEHAGTAVPLGFDLAHYVFQREFVYRGRSAAEAVSTMDREAPPHLAAIGAPAEPTLTLYLMEMAVRTEELERDSGRCDERLRTGLAEVLAARLR